MFWALALIAAFFSTYCLSAKFNCEDCVEYIPEVPLRMYSSYHMYGVTSVDSTKQTFGLDIEVQLKWNDSRIEFKENELKLKLNEKGKRKLWLPHFHVWQELNKQRETSRIELIKVNENVTTLQMKSHLQIDVSCSMNFTDFPNDKQNCFFVMYDEDYNNTEIIMETVITSAKKFFHPFSNTNITVTTGDFTPYSNVSITGIKMSLSKCLTQNVSPKWSYLFKMSHPKCLIQNTSPKMSHLKFLKQNISNKMSVTKCFLKNASLKMSHSKCLTQDVSIRMSL